MIRFAKRANCPSSEILEAHRDDALAPVLVRERIAAHINDCDFCAAEFQLLGVAARKTITSAPAESARVSAQEREDAATNEPAMPLALRLFAESQFAERALLHASLNRLRAA
ncbi:MAG: hypothetical protein QOE33_1608 [Acidobacteriota bacterium]|nr:hypothetical protein [Acidobacteriota bacterium]